MSMVARYWKVHILSPLPRHLIDGFPRNSAVTGVEFRHPKWSSWSERDGGYHLPVDWRVSVPKWLGKSQKKPFTWLVLWLGGPKTRFLQNPYSAVNQL